MYYVEALTQKRQAEWESIFGLTTLPVQGPQPVMTPSGSLAYRLDAAALNKINPHLLGRLIGWLVMRRLWDESEARKEVYAGFPITADHTVKLIVKSDEQGTRSNPARLFFPFGQPGFIRAMF
jgi:hypothetical protein